MARPRPSTGGGGSGSSGAGAVLRFMDRRLTILRGQAVGKYGDISDVGTPVYTDVPAAIAETSQTAFDPATQRPSIVRAIKGILPGWADVQLTDTILDPDTGWYYLVEDISQEPGIGFYPPRQILTLRMRSGVTVEGEQGGQ